MCCDSARTASAGLPLKWPIAGAPLQLTRTLWEVGRADLKSWLCISTCDSPGTWALALSMRVEAVDMLWQRVLCFVAPSQSPTAGSRAHLTESQLRSG